MVPENSERLPNREKVTYDQLIDKVIDEIVSYDPNMIGLSALSDDYPLGLRIMEKLKKISKYSYNSRRCSCYN